MRVRSWALLAASSIAAYAQSATAQDTAVAVPAAPAPAPAAASSPPQVGEIVVTAQKRAQSINSVGLTISAATSDTLLKRGVSSTADLSKVAPGFTFTLSQYSTPVYTLRGIGLNDYSLGSAPSVAVYVDEIPLPYPTMGVGATLDLDRVEILKGPQGTMFGESATGGAINYIAAKPTDTFKSSADLSYERFGRFDGSGYVSGPITDTLKARLALRAVEGGDWQYSVSRPDDKNGKSDQLIGRLLLDFKPSDRLSLHLNVNGWRDRSDTQQPQFIKNQLNLLPAADPRDPYARIDPAAYNSVTDTKSANYDPSFIARQRTVLNRVAAGEQAALAYLAGPNGDGSAVSNDPRKADWSPNFPDSSNDSFYQAALRADYKLSHGITLSSLTAYEHTKIDRYFDNSGVPVNALDQHLFGNIKNFSQELRLTGTGPRFNWILGGNYEWSKIFDDVVFYNQEMSITEQLPGLRFQEVNSSIHQTVKSYAAFANGEYKVTDHLSVNGGGRYTDSRRHADMCNSDPSASQNLSKTFGNSAIVPGFGYYDLQTYLGLNPANHVAVGPGQCYMLNVNVPTNDPDYMRPILDPYHEHLNEHNVSFRAGINYKFDGGALLYATISQGYKAGIISGISTSRTDQYVPAKQEKLVAYEAGFKIPLLDHRVQFNGAGFYYDYRDKQVRVRVRDAIFGLLEALVNVPKSRIWGLEGEFVVRPLPGLDLSANGTYLNSKVISDFAEVPTGTGSTRPLYNAEGYTGNFKGSTLPYTPKFSAVADGQYQFSISQSKNLFFGGTLTYQARSNTTFKTADLPADEFNLRSHALVDLRIGIASQNGSWRLTAYGRNVFNKYYETSIYAGIDTVYRYAGRPATYGLTLSLRTP